MVVVHHALIMLSEREHLPVGNWVNGSSGVALFFVISGFVMTLSALPLRSQAHPIKTFLFRRLERIVPMYWLVTTAKVVVLLSIPTLGINALSSWSHIVSSYAFVPHLSSNNTFEPVVIVGWTLNFEMAFYLLFGIALSCRRHPLWLLLRVLVFLGMLPFWWTLMFEFLFGILLALGVHWIRASPWFVGAVLMSAGLAALLSLQAPFLLRGVIWGVPATAAVAGALILERFWERGTPKWLLELGDASYSIYLIHTCVLPGAGLLLTRWEGLTRRSVAFSLVLAVLLSLVAGELAYRLVERPIVSLFKSQRIRKNK